MHSLQLPNAENTIVKGGQPITVNNPPNMAKPFNQWPLWAKTLSLVKSDSDKGVGDTIARTIGDSNSAAFKAWYMVTFKRSCGCAARQEKWNKEFQY
jgi:hypothetical protein